MPTSRAGRGPGHVTSTGFQWCADDDPNSFLIKHLLNVVIGISLGWVVMRLDYRTLRAYTPLAYGVVITLLLVMVNPFFSGALDEDVHHYQETGLERLHHFPQDYNYSGGISRALFRKETEEYARDAGKLLYIEICAGAGACNNTWAAATLLGWLRELKFQQSGDASSAFTASSSGLTGWTPSADLVSDECDPTVDVTRDNALAFLTVFAVQCAAIALGHVVLMWKLRRMVAENKRSRRRAMADPRLLQRARRFVADAKAREEQQQSQRRDGDGGNKLSARARFRRAGIVAKFAGRAMKAAHEASTVESVDDVVLEISEAVAAHWKESRSYFVAVGTAAMAVTFMQSGLVVNSQTS